MFLKKNFTFVDLFAGVGGFHLAMEKYSGGKARCLMASEIDPDAAKVYEANFGVKPEGDITDIEKLPEGTDVLCAGFPCQAFSKAGKQGGFKDKRGVLFDQIIRLLQPSEWKEPDSRPKILLLENVWNLVSHDKGNTWNTIKKKLRDVGYTLNDRPFILSPVDFGVPQTRKRALIPCVRSDIYSGPINLEFPVGDPKSLSMESIKEDPPTDPKILHEDQAKALAAWERFMKIVGFRTIGFPIWSDYFDGFAEAKESDPDWKKEFIRKNRELYLANEAKLQKWIKSTGLRDMTPTYRKFEWQAGTSLKSVYDGLIQFRPSGIRVKPPTSSPALVAMVHLPFMGPWGRAITVREAARLQSFPDDFRFPEANAKAFKQLGNAVNVQVVLSVFREFNRFLEGVTDRHGI